MVNILLKLSDYVTPEELKSLCQKSDLIGWYRVFINYALIYLAFLLIVLFPNTFTYLLASCVIAGRILGIGVLNHDAGHLTLFKTASLNTNVGRWLLGALVLIDYDAFRKGHLQHHQYAGTKNDPDLLFVRNYPATPMSMVRKFARDVSGVNGVKEFLYQMKVSSWQKHVPTLLLHTMIIVSLIPVDGIWAYSAFWVAFFFIYPLFIRIRIMGEHGGVTKNASNDPRENTATTYATSFERLFVAPNHVNFHLEHHIHQNIPAHNLEKAHKLFKSRAVYEGFDCTAPNYWYVIKRCINSETGISNSKQHASSSANYMN